MRNNKPVKFLLMAVAGSLLMSACNTMTAVDQDPKMAVQKGIQPLISKSFDFNSQISMTINNQTVAKPGLEEKIKKINPDPSGTDTLAKLLVNASNITASGSVDQTHQQLSSNFSVSTKTDSFGFVAKAPVLIDLKKSEVIMGLKDFNPLIIQATQKQLHPDYQDKYVRLRFGDFLNQYLKKIPGISSEQSKEMFDRIDEKNFSYIALDKTDRAVKGRAKIRLNLDKDTLTESTDNKTSATTNDEQAQEQTNPPKLKEKVFADFTLDQSGNVIRVHLNMENLSIDQSTIWNNEERSDSENDEEWPDTLGYRYSYANASFDTQFSHFGQASFHFAPKESEIIDFANERETRKLLSSYDNYIEKAQITQIYGELSAVKTAVEAALFDGKIPVITQEEEKKNPDKFEWVGWTGSTMVTQLSINSLPRKKPNRWYLVAVLGNQAASDFHGSQLVLDRKANGLWACTYYTTGKDLAHLAPSACTVVNKKFTLPKK